MGLVGVEVLYHAIFLVIIVSIPHRLDTTRKEVYTNEKNITSVCQFLIGKVQRLINHKQFIRKCLLNVSIPHRQGTTLY